MNSAQRAYAGINYTAGSTTAALKLSFYGRARVKTPRC